MGISYSLGVEFIDDDDPRVNLDLETISEIRTTSNIIAETPGGRDDRVVTVQRTSSPSSYAISLSRVWRLNQLPLMVDLIMVRLSQSASRQEDCSPALKELKLLKKQRYTAAQLETNMTHATTWPVTPLTISV